MSTITFAASTARPPWPHRPGLLPAPELVVPCGDDEHLAFLLVATWSLRTGRNLRYAPPQQLTEIELLEFWADPDCEVSPAVAGLCKGASYGAGTVAANRHTDSIPWEVADRVSSAGREHAAAGVVAGAAPRRSR